MTETLQQIRAAVMNGLTRPEIEGLLNRKLEPNEVMEFNKIKAVLKLREADKAKQDEAAKSQTSLAPVGITNKLAPKLPPLDQRYTREQLEECIERQYGIVTSICNELDCTYSQFYKAVKHMGLQEKLSNAKKNLCSMAEQVIVTALQSSDEKTRIDAAKYTLSRLGKDLGWGDTPFAAMQVEISPGEKQNQIKAIFGIKQDGAGDNNT